MLQLGVDRHRRSALPPAVDWYRVRQTLQQCSGRAHRWACGRRCQHIALLRVKDAVVRQAQIALLALTPSFSVSRNSRLLLLMLWLVPVL